MSFCSFFHIYSLLNLSPSNVKTVCRLNFHSLRIAILIFIAFNLPSQFSDLSLFVFCILKPIIFILSGIQKLLTCSFIMSNIITISIFQFVSHTSNFVWIDRLISFTYVFLLSSTFPWLAWLFFPGY